MKQRVLAAFIVCLAVVYSGCAQTGNFTATTTTPTPTAVESDSSKSLQELPRMYGPLDRRHKAMRPAEEVFIRVKSMRKLTRLTAAELKPIRNAGFSGVLISKGDLETLKALIASDWAPVVIIKSPAGPKRVRVVAGYDDDRGQIILLDPINFTTQARLEYSAFSKQWDDPQAACLLIFYRGAVDTIKNDLKRYLPEEKVDSLVIKKR